jgi:hypothetical protein
MADESGVYSEIATGLTEKKYVATGLTPGMTYTFKVESRNSYDYSAYSAAFSILCAIEPEAPAAPTSAVSNDLILIDWVEPVTNGSPITAYRIYILENDGLTWTEETVECIGNSADVLANTACEVSSFTLLENPYNLVEGDSV